MSFGVDIYANYDNITAYKSQLLKPRADDIPQQKVASKKRVSIDDCGIPIGDRIVYVREPHFVLEVLGNRKVCDAYGREGYITPILKKLSEAAGICYAKHDSFLQLWTYRGVLLADIYEAGGVDAYFDSVDKDEVETEQTNVENDTSTDIEDMTESVVVSDGEKEDLGSDVENEDDSLFDENVVDIFSLF